MGPTIRIREGQLRKFRAMSGLTTDTELAARMGVNRGTIHRVLTQKKGLSEKFIASLLTVFPHLEFGDLFELASVEDDEDEQAGAA